MKNTTLLFALFTVVTMNVNASQENIDRAAKGTTESPISVLIMANALAAQGIEQKDPLLLVTSAKLLKLNAIETKARQKVAEGGSKSSKEGRERYTPDRLLEYAQEWSGDNKAYKSLIAQVESLQTRGRVGGAAQHVDAVDAGASDHYELMFYGREWAEVAVIGDGDTDLDLYVRDENGNVVCEDTDSTDTMYCAWKPKFDGNFTISIKNYGEVYNEYLIMTN